MTIMTMVTQAVPPQLDPDDNNSDGEYEDTAAQARVTLLTQQQDPAEEAFNSIVQDAAENKLTLSKANHRDDFRKKYSRYFNARIQPENLTLFHFVATRIGHIPLTIFLIKNCSDQLKLVNNSGNTPFYTAVRMNNPIVFTTILEKHPNPDDLLKVTCDHGRNSIHAAIITNSIKEEHVLKLINKASEGTLCMQDHDGLTPLHLAVQYSRCSESQVRIVRELISRGDKALDKFSKNPPNLSVYEYHKYTREEAQQQLRTSLGANAGHEATDIGTPITRTDPTKTMQEVVLIANQKDGQTARELLDNQTIKGHSLDRNRMFLSDGPISNGVEHGSSEQHRDNIHGQDVVPALATAMNKQKHNKAASRHLPERDVAKEKWANKILQEIKLQYLRSTFPSIRRPHPRDQSQALRFIHGANIEGTDCSARPGLDQRTHRHNPEV